MKPVGLSILERAGKTIWRRATAAGQLDGDYYQPRGVPDAGLNMGRKNAQCCGMIPGLGTPSSSVGDGSPQHIRQPPRAFVKNVTNACESAFVLREGLMASNGVESAASGLIAPAQCGALVRRPGADVRSPRRRSARWQFYGRHANQTHISQRTSRRNNGTAPPRNPDKAKKRLALSNGALQELAR